MPDQQQRLLEGDELGAESCATVLARLVGDSKFAEIVAHHVGLNLNLGEIQSIVHADDAGNHLGQDDGVAKVSLYCLRLLQLGCLLLRFPQSLQKLGSGLAGVVIAGVVVAIVETVGHKLFPVDVISSAEAKTPQGRKKIMEQISTGALLFVLAAYVLGSFAGGAVAARLAPFHASYHALAVGAVLLAVGISNLVQIPHPRWFAVVSLLVFLPAAFIGSAF